MAKGFVPRSWNNDTTVSTIWTDTEQNLRSKSIPQLFKKYFDFLNYFERQENKWIWYIAIPWVSYNIMFLEKTILEKIEETDDLELLNGYKNMLDWVLYSDEVKARLKKILNKINTKLWIVETKDWFKENVEELLAA